MKKKNKMAMERMNGSCKIEGKELLSESGCNGKRWQRWLWRRGGMRYKEKKTTDKNRRKETKENQKRKKMEVQATNDRNKKKK